MSSLDTESATIAGYWIGLGSFVVGLISIGLTIYAMFSRDMNALVIAGSGWLGATLVGITGWITTIKLLRHAKSCERECTEARLETASSKHEFERLLTISEYLVTKTTRPATRRRAQTSNDEREGSSNDN